MEPSNKIQKKLSQKKQGVFTMSTTTCIIREHRYVRLKRFFMQHYIWFHPTYIRKSNSSLINGQKKNANKHGYIILDGHDLSRVTAEDHLTLVGHSTAPASLVQSDSDTGNYIQGDSALTLTQSLIALDLVSAPRLLILECCRAGIINGLAQQLSKQPFFKYSMIEAYTGPVGRNPGNIYWSMPTDQLGRSVFTVEDNYWMLYFRNQPVAAYTHGSVEIQNLLAQISPDQFHHRFLGLYNPGFFGGRAIRHYLSSCSLITMQDALLWARQRPESASAKAVDEALAEHHFSCIDVSSLGL